MLFTRNVKKVNDTAAKTGDIIQMNSRISDLKLVAVWSHAKDCDAKVSHKLTNLTNPSSVPSNISTICLLRPNVVLPLLSGTCHLKPKLTINVTPNQPSLSVHKIISRHGCKACVALRDDSVDL